MPRCHRGVNSAEFGPRLKNGVRDFRSVSAIDCSVAPELHCTQKANILPGRRIEKGAEYHFATLHLTYDDQKHHLASSTMLGVVMQSLAKLGPNSVDYFKVVVTVRSILTGQTRILKLQPWGLQSAFVSSHDTCICTCRTNVDTSTDRFCPRASWCGCCRRPAFGWSRHQQPGPDTTSRQLVRSAWHQ